MGAILEVGKLIIKLIILLVLAAAVYVLAASSTIMSKKLQTAPVKSSLGVAEANKENIMKIFSPVFKEGEAIPVQYTCDGGDFNPALEISGAPQGTESLALLMDDPDSPSGNFVHWIIWNIRAEETLIQENAKPEGAAEGVNGFGRVGYGGPCPHSGTHRYFFRLYALDKMLDLTPGADAAALKQAMEGHVLAEVELMGRYTRR